MSNNGPLGGAARILRAALLVSLAAAAVVTVGATDAVSAQDSATEVRITARRLADGRVEFGLQQRQTDDSWGERLLPTRRFFPADAEPGRWHSSSSPGPAVPNTRIVARMLTDGRVEFGLQQRRSDNTWGERLLPDRRNFPTDAEPGRWLVSASLHLTTRSSAETAETAIDPLGLIAGFDFTSAYGIGEDIWEVWLCDTPSGDTFSEDPDVRLNPANYAGAFTQRVTDWFDWQSGGAYEPVFRPGGLVTAPDAEAEACAEAVERTIRSNDAHGVLVVSAKALLTDDGVLGYGWCGHYSRRTWPDNSRSVVVYAGAVADPAVVAHELGHALCWPHSYSGGTLVDGEVWQYDNPMDRMSGGLGKQPDNEGALAVGTIAINRYAAGWISPDDVEIHVPGTTGDYLLAPAGEPGTQMLVLPDPETGTDGLFATLGARRRGAGGEEWQDAAIDAEGIEFYWIDQTERACLVPDRGACHGLDRRTAPIDGAPYTTNHVVDGGGEFWLMSGYEVSVGEYSTSAGAYPVSVRPADAQDWVYTSDPDGDAWTSARMHSEEHDLVAPYSIATLTVTCVDETVGATVYLWSEYIDWTQALSGTGSFRAVDVSYGFGDARPAAATRWAVTSNGRGVRAPAVAVREIVRGLTDPTDPLRVTIKAADGSVTGTITFAARADADAVTRVLADCGSAPGDEIPISDWSTYTNDSDPLQGSRPVAALRSFQHDLVTAGGVRPVDLLVECFSDELRIALRLGAPILEDGPGRKLEVARRFDDAPIVTQDWPVLDDRSVHLHRIHVPGFLSDLQRHERLVLQLRSDDGDKIGTVVFSSLAGAREATETVRSTCG